jgi:hypothetical protein
MKEISKLTLTGIGLSLVGIASVFVEGDLTACMFLLPLGLYAIFTKE